MRITPHLQREAGTFALAHPVHPPRLERARHQDESPALARDEFPHLLFALDRLVLFADAEGPGDVLLPAVNQHEHQVVLAVIVVGLVVAGHAKALLLASSRWFWDSGGEMPVEPDFFVGGPHFPCNVRHACM